MKAVTRAKEDAALRDEWLRLIEALRVQIMTWASQEQSWQFTGQEEREVEEPYLGRYVVEVLRLETPEGEVRLDPIARNYPGSGIVELYAWPTSYRVRLIYSEDYGWRVLTDSGIYLHQPWDREHFVTLIRDLIGAEDMIAVG